MMRAEANLAKRAQAPISGRDGSVGTLRARGRHRHCFNPDRRANRLCPYPAFL